MNQRRDTSADIAARFVAARERARQKRQARIQERKRRRARQRQIALSRGPAPPRRIALDLAEPTARLIHDVLLDALHANVDFGDRGALLMIAEQMVAQALGVPACDEPPLNDHHLV